MNFSIILSLGAVLISSLFFWNSPQKDDLLGVALRVFTISQGGTGTSTAPSSGSLLVGNASGTYDVTTTIANLNFINGTSTNFNSSNYSGSGTFTNVSSTNFSSNGILESFNFSNILLKANLYVHNKYLTLLFTVK